MENYKVSIVKKTKWSDPRHIQIDIDMPVVDTTGITSPSKSNRVMPFRKMGKLFSILKRSTKTFKNADISHFWVSGYIRLDFYLKSVSDRMKIKRLVSASIVESGGFQTLEEWIELYQKEKGRMKIFSFSGSGSNIRGGQINTGYEYL